MLLIGYSLSGLVAAGIMVIGARFLWQQAAASHAFGISKPPSPLSGLNAWLAVKGVRDIVSGLFVVLLMVGGSPRLLGEFMLVASFIAIGDAAIVLRSGGSKIAALGIHGLTAPVIIVAGAILILAAS